MMERAVEGDEVCAELGAGQPFHATIQWTRVYTTVRFTVWIDNDKIDQESFHATDVSWYGLSIILCVMSNFHVPRVLIQLENS